MVVSYVLNLNRVMDNGATEPLLGTIKQDDTTYNCIIKTKGNIGGVRTLINEYIAGQLAVRLGLPVPDNGFALLDKNTIVDSECSENISEFDFGSCFYSRLIEHVVPLNGLSAAQVDNIDDIYKLLLFDGLIYNCDRNPGNLLVTFSKSKRKFYAIDHSNVFMRGHARWDAGYFKGRMTLDDLYDESFLLDNEAQYQYFYSNKFINPQTLMSTASDFQDKCTHSFIQTLVNSVPEDLLTEVSMQDLNSIGEFLSFRITHFPQICDMIIRHLERRNG